MNKKIFTLAAAFGLAASSFTAGAVDVIDQEMNSGEYYQLVVSSGDISSTCGDQYYIGVDNAKRDSLVLIKSDNTSFDIFSSLNYWKVEYTFASSGKPVFTITNKATGQKLAFPELATDATANAFTSSAGRNALTWLDKGHLKYGATIVSGSSASDAGNAGAITDATGPTVVDYKMFMYTSAAGQQLGFVNGTLPSISAYINGVQAITTAPAAATIYAVQPGTQKMTAFQLNNIKGGSGFELKFTPGVTESGNKLEGTTLQAMWVKDVTASNVEAAYDWTGDYLTIKSAGASASEQLVVEAPASAAVTQNHMFLKAGTMKNAAGKDVNTYLVVDTVLLPGNLLTFTYDTLKMSGAITANSSKAEIKAAPGRDLGSYMFSIHQVPTTGDLAIGIAGLPGVPASNNVLWGNTNPVKSSDFSTAYDCSVYMSITGASHVISAKKAATATDLKNTVITFNQGTAIDNLDTKVAYFVQPVKEDGSIDAAKYYVAGMAGEDNPTAATASDYMPSTQFGLVNNGGNMYTIFNRETGKTLHVGSDVSGGTFAIDAAKGIYNIGGVRVALVARPDVKGENVGYRAFTASEVKNLTFAIKVKSLGSEDIYLTTKDTAIVATNDVEKRIMFRLKDLGAKRFGNVANDSLKRHSYMLLSADKKSYLAYDKGLNAYKMTSVAWDGNKVTSGNVVVNAKTDTAFVYFQAVGKDIYAMTLNKIYTATDGASTSFNPKDAWGNDQGAWSGAAAGVRNDFGVYGEKIFVEITNGVTTKAAYDASTTTLFVIENGTTDYDNTIQKPSHKNISLLSDGDMMITPMADGFANLKRAGQLKSDAYTADNLKLYVDTANMTDVNKPTYYIATTQNLDAACIKNGEMSYMVSLSDSVNVKGYTYTDDNLPRVGFIEGNVVADSIYLYRGHAQGDTTSYKAQASEAEWAFAINPNGGVSIENIKNGGFVATINDVLVMVPTLDKAAQFTAKTTDTPTGNESTEANTISVVAGEGNVTVYGAAGKKVIVSNVLGQETTIIATSDSQTISAPQGVVIVAVEGEAAVKAVVK